MVAVAITATVPSLHQNAGAALYSEPPQPITNIAWTPLVADEYWSASIYQGFWATSVAYEPWLDFKSYGSGSELKYFSYPETLEPKTGPSELTPIEPRPDQSTSLEPPQDKPISREPLPSYSASLERSRPVEASRSAPRAKARSSAPVSRIAFSAPVLAPFAHTSFCLSYPGECKVRKIVFRGGAIKLTAERRALLARINTEVNRAIRSEPNTEGLAAEKWLIAPKAGECHDYAVTKRHELIARGWPARALLLAEVVVPSGEHHLVLVVRTHEGDLVADNLNGGLRPWSKTGYQWVRIQTPANPLYWATLESSKVYAQLR